MPDGTHPNLDISDVTEALRRTTPEGVRPVEIQHLAKRNDYRRHRRTALASAAAVLSLGAAAGAVITSSSDTAPDVSAADGARGVGSAEPLTEPVGAWRRAADPPFAPRSDAINGSLNDGRMLVWGGHDDRGDQRDDLAAAPGGFSDGAIYDPTSDTWEKIPVAPIDAPSPGGSTATLAQLVDDRLAVVGFDSGRGIESAVYDIADGVWEEAPVWDETSDYLNYMAWDGETLALVRVDEGEQRIDQPVTVRWQPGDDAWTDGAPFPLGVRNAVGTAFDGSYLAVWGGTDRLPIDRDEDRPAFDDGAIYDVTGDRWELMAEAPLAAGTHAEMVWLDGRLVVGGRLGTEAGQGILSDLSAYDPVAQTWEALPEAPASGAHPAEPGAFFVEGEEPLLVASSMDEGEYAGMWLYSGDEWQRAPLPGLRWLGDHVVAGTERPGDPGDDLFELQVRVGADDWLVAEEAPFAHRRQAATVTNDDILLVVGGLEGADRQLQGDAWVFDLYG